ncbi:hypothetical protein GMOD_00000023 [Pyrenophora seminiperda CCB06]|uniref:Uncharacterized protein n=1 Tax=Pyrenophora seminiperda CCB06 TaxID=1302712 RepID=A0A3M7M674_9PLEO|nr:hypothetical protein GMOD_00000023 [Pyrenophora seminiperda CCB06]
MRLRAVMHPCHSVESTPLDPLTIPRTTNFTRDFVFLALSKTSRSLLHSMAHTIRWRGHERVAGGYNVCRHLHVPGCLHSAAHPSALILL